MTAWAVISQKLLLPGVLSEKKVLLSGYLTYTYKVMRLKVILISR
jgi:hypothetical protein